MFALVCLATFFGVPRADHLQGDSRLAKRLSIRQEIISLADLTAELGKQTGVPLYTKHRIADRKVTIVFKDRPAEEAMNCVADCMLMSWRKDGSGYELDLSDKAAAAEARTEAEERDRERGGIRDAVREIRRLWALSPQGRDAERQKLDKELSDGLKDAGASTSPRMAFLDKEISAIHMAGFIEVVGAALSKAKLDDDGVPVGTTWFSSAKADDQVGHIDVNAIPTNPRSDSGGFADAIGVVTYKEETHEFDSKLFGIAAKDGAGFGTSAGGWSVLTPAAPEPSALDRLMAEWSRPVSRETAEKHADDPKPLPASNEYRSGMFGRAQLLVDFADRSGVPVVADAYRRSLTNPIWLAGTTVQGCLGSYSTLLKAPFRGRPDYIREDSGWLMLRADHWWWNLKSEIPESVLRPLEAEAVGGHSPLPLNEYLRFLPVLSTEQIAGLRFPELRLLRFPVGSLNTSMYSVTLFSRLDSAGRAQALSQEGIDLSTASPEAQALAYDALVRIATNGSEGIPFIRAILRGGPGVMKGFKFFAEDEIGKTTNLAQIGDGREINLSFSYGPTYQNSPHSESFSCSNSRP